MDSYIFDKLRWFWVYRSGFTWVCGLSEDEIENFSNLYQRSFDEIKSIINNTEDKNLQNKLLLEFNNFPSINYKEFIIDVNNPIFIFVKLIYPFKTIRKTLKGKNFLNEIRIVCDKMINYIEHKEWLELK